MSIWATVEISAWSRNFDYNNYIILHKANGCTGKLLTLDAYQALCELFNTIHEDELK